MDKSYLQRIVAAIIERVTREHPGASLRELTDALEAAYPFPRLDSPEIRVLWRREITKYVWNGSRSCKHTPIVRFPHARQAIH
jgi:hypothetical protein